MKTEELRTLVIESLVVRNTLDGAFQRANIYKKSGDITTAQKKHFRDFLAFQLKLTLSRILIISDYTDNHHFEIITQFSETVSEKHKNILEDGRLRIGHAQKLINLYWKLSWLLKKDIPKPVHCPFDSIIISKLPKEVRHITWTKMDRIDDYKALVAACREMLTVSDTSYCITDWELKVYYDIVNYNTSEQT